MALGCIKVRFPPSPPRVRCLALLELRGEGRMSVGLFSRTAAGNRAYCWFTRDVTAAMLVVKNKSISLLWATKLYFHVNSSRKYSVVLTRNMAAWPRGCQPLDLVKKWREYSRHLLTLIQNMSVLCRYRRVYGLCAVV